MIRVAVCGTTQNTVQCAQALTENKNFSILWCVTPPPKPIGRKKTLTPTPVQTWAEKNDIPVHHVEKSLKPLQSTLTALPPIDFLLVVDFGYLVPDWLLELPQIAPINIHPSDLPKYRGSSPGQFALLYGENSSAVCIMRMSIGLDEGPIITSIPFSIEPNETSPSYYQKAFTLASTALPEVLLEYAQNRQEKPQPAESTTVIAKRFSREDGYIKYSVIQVALKGEELPQSDQITLSPILQQVFKDQPTLSIAQLIERAVRALSPWPGIWTIAPEYRGRTNVRCKILKTHLSEGRLIIDQQKFEGE